MIAFDLRCDNGHCFEGWFRSTDDFEAQQAAGALACPVCGSGAITKALMAPNVVTGGARVPSAPAETAEPAVGLPRDFALREALRQLRRSLEAVSDDVGAAFPEEARRIHHGQAEPRHIRGEASEAEAEDLRDEGIPVQRVPWISCYDD